MIRIPLVIRRKAAKLPKRGTCSNSELTVRRILLLVIGCAQAVAVEQAAHVGSRKCFACHEQIYRTYVETSMGRSMRPANDLAPGFLQAEATISLSPNRVLKVTHTATEWMQSESEPGVFNDEHTLDYVIGSGVNGFSFIVRRGNWLVEAPLSFYSRTREWHLSPGYEIANAGFTRTIAAQCVGCHSGRAQPVAHSDGQYLDPPFRELAIGCENCHGPGSLHIQNPTRPGTIVNPGKLPARLAEDICLNCHQGGDARVFQPGKSQNDFRPGQWLVDTVAIFKIPAKLRDQKDTDLLEHHSAIKVSRCFRASGGKLSCLTCHDPHIQPVGEQANSYYRTKCFTCHTDASCRLPISARIKQAGSDNCITCHMPKRQVAVISHSALTNHRIPARPDEKFQPNEKNSDIPDLILVNQPPRGETKLPEITVLRAYAELASQNGTYLRHYQAMLKDLSARRPQEPYVQAALGHQALAEGRTAEAIEHLSLGLPLGETAVLTDMAKALTAEGRLQDAVAYLKRAIEQESYNAALRKTLILDYINLRRYPEAKQQMQEYLEIFPGDSFMRGLLVQAQH